MVTDVAVLASSGASRYASSVSRNLVARLPWPGAVCSSLPAPGEREELKRPQDTKMPEPLTRFDGVFKGGEVAVDRA